MTKKKFTCDVMKFCESLTVEYNKRKGLTYFALNANCLSVGMLELLSIFCCTMARVNIHEEGKHYLYWCCYFITFISNLFSHSNLIFLSLFIYSFFFLCKKNLRCKNPRKALSEYILMFYTNKFLHIL